MELAVQDLGVARGGFVVLSGVSFRLGEGQALLIRGPNGIGKTTLLRTLAGLQPPLAGTLSASPDDIAYASHADGNKATLSVAENLQFWADVHGTGTIGAALDALGLIGLKDRLAAHLSAGQKRRLGLARLLVTGRPIWLLDEPTVSLDDRATAQVTAVLNTHLGRGGLLVVASHVDIGLRNAATLSLEPFQAGGHRHAGAFDEAVG